MEEKRYSFTFMKEYVELFKMTDLQLANMFGCGFKAVKKLLSGELTIKESALEEILYELGYKDYDTFKANILRKVELRKEEIRNQELHRIKMEQMEKEKAEKKKEQEEIMEENKFYEQFNFNSMNNTDRIIISVLCDEKLSKSIKEVALFLNVKPDYVKNKYNEILENINNDIEKEKVKAKV